eukprot:CCRYP_018753-RA/>CCRYP_018753-RA protein AED:0.02 eAED:0.02 QI:307/1/1/1/1/1/2/234/120
MKRSVRVLLILSAICIAATAATSEALLFGDKGKDGNRAGIDDTDRDESLDKNWYFNRRRLRVQKTCRDGKKCKTKSDCSRGGCSVREFPDPVKAPFLSCRNGDGCVRFCRDGSKCKERFH